MHPTTEEGGRNDELKSAGREWCSSKLSGDPNERKDPHTSKSITEQTPGVQTSNNPARTGSSLELSVTSVSDEPFARQTNEESLQLVPYKKDQKATLKCPDLSGSYKEKFPHTSFLVESTSSSSSMTMTIRSLDLAASSEKQSQGKTTQMSLELTPLLITHHVPDSTITCSSVEEVDENLAPSIIEQLNALDLAKNQSRITKNCATNPLLASTSLSSSRASASKSQRSDTSQKSAANELDSPEHAHSIHSSSVTLGAEKLTETASTKEKSLSVARFVALKISGRSQTEKCREGAVNPQVDHVGDSFDARSKRDKQTGNDDDVKVGKALGQSSKLMATEPAAVSPSTFRLSSSPMSSSVQPNRHDEELCSCAMEEVETNKSWILSSATTSKESSIRPQW